MTDNGLHPTSAADWKGISREGVTIPLPSGFNATLKPVSLIGLIRNGKIPDILTSLAHSVLFEEKGIDELKESLEVFKNMDELFEIVLPEVFASPRVIPSDQIPADDEICVSDIDDVDKQVAFRLAISGVSALKTFRDQQGGNVPAVSNVSKNGNKAKRVSRAKSK